MRRAHIELARRLAERPDLYNCATCAKEPALYAFLGHDGPPQNYWTENLLSGKPLRRCPVRDLLDARRTTPALMDEIDRYATFYIPAYRDGHLLGKGGIADQPARYLAMINEILDLEARAEQKHAELVKEDQR